MALLNRTDFDWSSTVTVKPSYIPNTHINIWTSIPGIAVSSVILYVTLTTKNLKGHFKIPIASLSSCSLLAASASLIFHLWYLLMYWANVELNFMVCSIIRRLYDHGQTPRIFCNLIIALDRHITVIYNKNYTKKLIISLIASSFLFSAVGFFASLSWGIVKDEDVCGPTLNVPSYFSNVYLGCWCTVTFVAFGLNVRLLYFVRRLPQMNKRSERRKTRREIKNENWMSVGITVQSFMPIIPFIMIIVGLVSYFNFGGAILPQWYFHLSLVLGYLNNTTIPLITALSIGPFRNALKMKFFKSSRHVVTIFKSTHSVQATSKSS